MECVFLYIITIIASPTLTSAAATIIIKKTKSWALVATDGSVTPTPAMCILENATNNKLTELSISSMHIKTMIELRLVSAPIMPMQNNTTDKNIYQLVSILIVLHITQYLQCLTQALLKKYLLFFLRRYH